MKLDNAITSRLLRFLKKVPAAVFVNNKLKARQVMAEYQQTCNYYSQLTMSKSHYELLANVRAGKHKVEPDPMRVFFIGTDEYQDKSGLLQSVCRHADTRWFVSAAGDYGHNDSREPSVRTTANAARLWEQLEELAHAGWVPDVVLTQTWPSLIDPMVFRNARERWGLTVINISMDDRHQYWGGRVDGYGAGTRALIPYIDLVLTAAPECVQWYEKEGCPALFFPEASDPDVFCPMPELPKIHDLSFVGARYGIREKLVKALRKAGVRVSTYGSGWKEGRIGVAEVPRLFAQSKIILGVGTIGYCDDFYALKLRDFDGPMSGSMYLTNDNKDLYDLFAIGQEIDTYRDIDDCISKVKYFLANNERREEIARAGRIRALSEHTWDHRFSTLFSRLGGS